MGLDMTIDRKTGYDLDMKPIYAVDHSWRKANQIHNWFEKRVGPIKNTVHYPLTAQILSDLMEDCITVLCNRASDELSSDQEDTVRAATLPTAEGFFFGDTDYDGWYYSDLEDAVRYIKDLFDNMSEEEMNDLAYWAWW